jgi:hypothetical protein
MENFMKNVHQERDFERIKKFLVISSGQTADVFKQRAVENMILRIIKEKPYILTMQDNRGLNLGMIAADYGLERVVVKCLDNETASLQVDNNGQTIGIHAAIAFLKKATIKAMRNRYAYWHLDNDGQRISNYAEKFMEVEELRKVEDKIKYERALENMEKMRETKDL